MVRLFICLSIVFCSNALIAQDAIVTDRPTQTASPYLVPKGFFQIETGYQYTAKNASFSCLGFDCSDDNLEFINFNSTLVRYGLFNVLEIRLTQNVSEERYKSKSNGNIISERNIRFVPTSISTKIPLLKSKNGATHISLIGEIGGNIFDKPDPTQEAEEKSMFSDVRASFQHDLEGLAVVYNIGWQWNQADGHSNVFYSFVLNFNLGGRTSLFIEPYGYFYKSESPDNRITGGMTFGIGPNMQLDFYGGRSFSYNGLHTILGFGFSARIAKN
jgi:Putative MetA-pathway of phenol degradation